MDDHDHRAPTTEPKTACHAEPGRSAVVDVLVDNHRQFLRFLERRVGDRALAEDILQAAFVRGLERAEQVRVEVGSDGEDDDGEAAAPDDATIETPRAEAPRPAPPDASPMSIRADQCARDGAARSFA